MAQEIVGESSAAYRDVIDHPDHKAGVEYGILTIVDHFALAPSVERVIGTLHHGGESSDWLVPNVAVRLEVPGDRGDLVSRVYTVRECAVGVAGRVDVTIDIVRHDGESPMMKWLRSLERGVTVKLLGPRAHFRPLIEREKVTGMFADETAIPALASILAAWPHGCRAEVFVETPDEQVVADIPQPDGVRVTWLQRKPEQSPGTTARLVDAAMSFSRRHSDPVNIWACGEHGEMRQIRDHFRRGRSMTKQQTEVFGYWRRTKSSSEIDQVRLERYREQISSTDRMTILDDFDFDD